MLGKGVSGLFDDLCFGDDPLAKPGSVLAGPRLECGDGEVLWQPCFLEVCGQPEASYPLILLNPTIKHLLGARRQAVREGLGGELGCGVRIHLRRACSVCTACPGNPVQ